MIGIELNKDLSTPLYIRLFKQPNDKILPRTYILGFGNCLIRISAAI